MRRYRSCLFFIVVWSVGLLPGHAAARQDIPLRIDVFVEQEPDSAAARLYFMDALSGLSTVIPVESGTRFTLVGDYVLFEKPSSQAIMRAKLDGSQEPHPFIRRGVGIETVRWVVSPDGQSVAWVQVDGAGTSEAYVARADGSDLRQLPIESPGPVLELAPLALANNMTDFFYDQAYTPAVVTGAPYDLYDHIVHYSIIEEKFYDLPLEPGCLCGAAFTADGRIFARLTAEEGQGPFELHVWDLPSGAGIRVAAPTIPFQQAGDMLLNDQGTLAVYSVATGTGLEATITAAQYGLVLVDVVTQQQVLLMEPGPTRYRPLAFMADDSSLLLATLPDGQTYKLSLMTSDLLRVSEKTYLGTIIPTP